MANTTNNSTDNQAQSGITRRNSVKVVSFLKFGKKIADNFYGGQITLTTEVDGVKKYLNIQVNSKIDLVQFTDKRVQIDGFFTGNMYQGRSSLRIFIKSIKEQPTGKGQTSVVFTTKTKFVREGEGEAKWTGAKGSLRYNAGTKDAENIQYANIDINGNRETLKLREDQVVTVKGFLGVNVVPANGDRKEFTVPTIVGLEILERQGEGTTPQPSTPAPQATTQAETAPTPQPATVAAATAEPGAINSDEIPF